MDSIPLGLLLEELLSSSDSSSIDQINWDVAQPENVDISTQLASPSNILHNSVAQHVTTAVSPTFDPANDTKENEHNSSDEDSADGAPKNKRKRRESKNKSEAKRRVKFTEQLATLRSILLGDQTASKPTKGSKITREQLLGSAIQEILALRQDLAHKNQLLAKPSEPSESILSKLGTGRFPRYYEYSRTSLYDPLNRSAYSLQDLDRAFQSIFAREIDLFCCVSAKRSEQTLLHSFRVLQDISNQIGKPEYQLFSGVLEQAYHSGIRYNPKELRRCLENNWTLYQNIRKTDPENLVLFMESEIGAWILADMAQMEYLTGNMEMSDQIHTLAKDLSKRLRHHGTNRFMLANLCWDLRLSVIPLPLAEKIHDILQGDNLWRPMGSTILGLSLIAAGKPKEGVETLEIAVFQMLEREDDLVELCMAPALLDAYTQAGYVDKGLNAVNYILKTYNELNIEGVMGKSELLRQRANLLMMKKYPNYLPIRPVIRNDPYFDETVSSEPAPTEIVRPTYGPLIAGTIQSYLALPIESGNEDIEMILRSAMNMAQIRGLSTIELRCVMDLARFFLVSGNFQAAQETIPTITDCMEKIRGPQTCPELVAARQVISLIQQYL